MYAFKKRHIIIVFIKDEFVFDPYPFWSVSNRSGDKLATDRCR